MISHTFNGQPCACGFTHHLNRRAASLAHAAHRKPSKPAATVAPTPTPKKPRRAGVAQPTVVASPVVVKVVRLAFQKARKAGDKVLRAFHLEAAMREVFAAPGARQ